MAAREYAPRNRRPASKKNGGVPGWVWMIAGLSMGLAVAAFVYVSRPTQAPLRGTSAASEDGFEPETRDPATLAAETRKPRTRVAKTVDDDDKVAIPPKEKSRFTFYELLPSQEVLVPSQAPAKPTAQAPPPADPNAATAATTTTGASAPAPAATPKPAPSSAPSAASTTAMAAPTFIIQVASYRAKAEAEKQKANLTLLGMEPRIETVTIDNRDTYYRVRIGPLRDERRAREALAQLESNGVNAMLVKVK